MQVDAAVRSGLPILHPVGGSFSLLGQDQEYGRGIFVDKLLRFVVKLAPLIRIGRGLTQLDEFIHTLIAVAHEVATTVGLALYESVPLGLEVAHRIESGVAPVIHVGLALTGQQLGLDNTILPEPNAGINANFAVQAGHGLSQGTPVFNGVQGEGKGLAIFVKNLIAISVGPTGFSQEFQGLVRIIGIRR